MAYINSTRTVVNNVGTDIALAGAGNLFTVSGSLGGTKSLTLSDGFINNGAPEANLIVPLLFPNGHNDLGPSLYLEITVAGVTNPIPVVSNQNGTLLPIPHHEMTEGGSTVYKVVDPNTILNVYYTADYDGQGTAAWVVVGNPLVLSSSTYSIYANGQYVENNTANILNYKTLTLIIPPASASGVNYSYVATDDCFFSVSQNWSATNNTGGSIYVYDDNNGSRGICIEKGGHTGYGTGTDARNIEEIPTTMTSPIFLKKEQKIWYTFLNYDSAAGRNPRLRIYTKTTN